MLINLNEFLISISYMLDFIELDIFGLATNHSKRVALISMKMAEKLGMSKEEVFDIVALAILHDNGASEKILKSKTEADIDKSKRSLTESVKEHCTIGETNIKGFPFLSEEKDIIKYHHEHFDGSGFYGLKTNEIPLMSQIIRLADAIEINFIKIQEADKEKIEEFLSENTNKMFAPNITDTFREISKHASFWLDIKDDFIDYALNKNFPDFTVDLELSKIREITKTISKIIDCKSKFTQAHSLGLSEKIAVMGKYYKKPKEEILKLRIAADLHDVGKLVISNSILDKPGALNDAEFNNVKQHPYYTRIALRAIRGFEDITEWASNHHEKINGLGYPFGKSGDELDFNSQLMTCLDIYQALTEERPYRAPMSYDKAIAVLTQLANKGELNKSIVEAIQKVFSQ